MAGFTPRFHNAKAPTLSIDSLDQLSVLTEKQWIYPEYRRTVAGITGGPMASRLAGSWQQLLEIGKALPGEVTKLDKTDGHCVWVKYYSGYTELVNKYGDQGKRLNLAIDPASGDILLAGGAINPNFGQGPIATFGEVDAFVVRLASDGTHKQSRSFFGEMNGADGAQHARSIALDRCGDVFIAGSFTRKLKIGNDAFTVADVPNDAGLNEADKPDVFVAKLRGDTLEPLWARAFGEAGDQQSFFAGTDDLGNVFVAGRTSNTRSAARTGNP